MPPTDPTTPYKRRFVKTQMSWPLQLINEKRVDVLVFVAVLIGLGLAALGYILFRFVLWVLDIVQGMA